jgi:hypothetical protein
MSRIDYDGISDARRQDSIITFTRLKEALLDAINDGEIEPCIISTRMELCSSCEGRGAHSLRFGAITSEEFAEWDEDSRSDYLRGNYDERCDECEGQNVVEVFDGLSEEAQDFVDRYIQGVYEDASDRYYERMAGC